MGIKIDGIFQIEDGEFDPAQHAPSACFPEPDAETAIFWYETALGLDAAAVVEFIKANKPTYPAFEAWVRKNGKKLTKADIHRHNLAILGYCHDDGTRKGILSASGLPDDGSVLPGAVDLNKALALLVEALPAKK